MFFFGSKKRSHVTEHALSEPLTLYTKYIANLSEKKPLVKWNLRIGTPHYFKRFRQRRALCEIRGFFGYFGTIKLFPGKKLTFSEEGHLMFRIEGDCSEIFFIYSRVPFDFH